MKFLSGSFLTILITIGYATPFPTMTLLFILFVLYAMLHDLIFPKPPLDFDDYFWRAFDKKKEDHYCVDVEDDNDKTSLDN